MASALSLPSIFHVNPRQSSNNHTPRSPRSTPMHFSPDYDFLQRMVSIPQPVVLVSVFYGYLFRASLRTFL